MSRSNVLGPGQHRPANKAKGPGLRAIRGAAPPIPGAPPTGRGRMPIPGHQPTSSRAAPQVREQNISRLSRGQWHPVLSVTCIYASNISSRTNLTFYRRT